MASALGPLIRFLQFQVFISRTCGRLQQKCSLHRQNQAVLCWRERLRRVQQGAFTGLQRTLIDWHAVPCGVAILNSGAVTRGNEGKDQFKREQTIPSANLHSPPSRFLGGSWKAIDCVLREDMHSHYEVVLALPTVL